ncbi:MAG: Fur family transcriptional regulator [Saprospiraceae bacterium]
MTEEILNKKEVRITPMRQLLLEFFLKKSKILGLSELEKVFPKSDRITIYRTLKTFEEKGIIHSVPNGNAEMKYALCQDCQVANHSDYHPHFYCSKCEELSCLESVFIPSVELPKDYSFEKIEMKIHGVCPKCQ